MDRLVSFESSFRFPITVFGFFPRNSLCNRKLITFTEFTVFTSYYGIPLAITLEADRLELGSAKLSNENV